MPWEVEWGADMPTRFVRKPGLRTALSGFAWVVRTAWNWVTDIVLDVMHEIGTPSSPARVVESVLLIMFLDHKSVLEVSDTVTEVRHVIIS